MPNGASIAGNGTSGASSNAVTRRQLQSARLTFSVSAWWHLQGTERWPIFYVSARKALELEGIYSPTRDWEEDYFVFRDIFLGSALALGTKSWDLEHLCAWPTGRAQDSMEAAGTDVDGSARRKRKTRCWSGRCKTYASAAVFGRNRQEIWPPCLDRDERPQEAVEWSEAERSQPESSAFPRHGQRI